MFEKDITIAELEPLFGLGYYNPCLVEKVKRDGWNDVDPIPVIEIPERLRIGERKYVFGDGRNRYDAALRTATISLASNNI